MVKRSSGLQADCKLRCHPILSNQLSNIISITVISFFSILLRAQTPIGLYEGLLGNSGAALSDSSAPSFYNPSLLIRKRNNSYAISGNTFGNFMSKTDSQETSSVNVYPSYLSSIFVSDSLVHEIFLINLAPTRLKNITNDIKATSIYTNETNRDGNKILIGYSMAFRSFPLALSYFAQYTEIQEFGFSEFIDQSSNLRTTSTTKGNFTGLAVGISVSGHSQFENYTLGYNLKIKPATVYKKNRSEIKNYIRGETLPSDYRIETTESEINDVEGIGSALVIGHGFKSGEHEFITDTQFIEKSRQSNSFDLYQSFGYRFGSGSGHQFLCGLNHSIGGDTKYLGQNMYISTGYSWLNKINRSTVGIYFYKSRLADEVAATGLTFGSEFSY